MSDQQGKAAAIEQEIKDHPKWCHPHCQTFIPEAYREKRQRYSAPQLTPISGVPCDWSMSDSGGYAYPHGIPAAYHVTEACEFFNGNFCKYHADMAASYSRKTAHYEAQAW